MAGEESTQGAALFLRGLATVALKESRFEEAEALLKKDIEIQERVGYLGGSKLFLAV